MKFSNDDRFPPGALSSQEHAIAEYVFTWLILRLHPANQRRRCKVTPSLIDWAQTLRIYVYVYVVVAAQKVSRAWILRWREVTKWHISPDEIILRIYLFQASRCLSTKKCRLTHGWFCERVCYDKNDNIDYSICRNIARWNIKIGIGNNTSHRPWWHHQMETFSALLAIYAVTGALVFSLICDWING